MFIRFRQILKQILSQSRFGFPNLIRWLINYFNQFDVSPQLQTSNTSFSDSGAVETFGSLCSMASQQDQIFKKFRSSRVLISVLDHVSIEQGYQYIKEISNLHSWTREFTQALKKIDSLGKPKRYKFKCFGTFSPTLLRYLKVYLELNESFKSLDNLDIVEIGVGFGGQASVINILSKPRSYTLYDIPPVLALSKRFMRELGIIGNLNFNDGVSPARIESDLVISNYAFSELNPEIQDLYLNNVILNSKRGYITWNYFSQYHYNGYSLADLVRIIPGSQIIPEKPLTSDANAIIVWG